MTTTPPISARSGVIQLKSLKCYELTMVDESPDPHYFRALRARLQAEFGHEVAERLQPHEAMAMQVRGLNIRDASEIIARSGRPLLCD